MRRFEIHARVNADPRRRELCATANIEIRMFTARVTKPPLAMRWTWRLARIAWVHGDIDKLPELMTQAAEIGFAFVRET